MLAALLAVPVPWLMARQRVFRRSPRAALAVWQAVTVGALASGLGAAPAALAVVLRDERPMAHLGTLSVLGAGSGLLLARLIVSGHRVGRHLRVLRRRHRELVDIIARHADGRLRVLAHPAPTAYCVPGLSPRLVISDGTLSRLTHDEIAAVLAHERSHLRARHDLLMEFFTVVHEALPQRLRRTEVMAEVRLLIEALADGAAVKEVGRMSTARALLALSGSATPEAALGAATTASPRIEVLAAGPLPRVVSALMYGYAAALLAVPVAVAAWSVR